MRESVLKKCVSENTETFERSKRFKTESALVDVFLDSIKEKICVSSRLKVMNEFETTNGIADLVLYTLRKDWKTYESIKVS